MSNNSGNSSRAFGSRIPVILAGILVVGTGLFVASLSRPALAQAMAAYLAVLVTTVLAAGIWIYVRTNHETLAATREMLQLIRSEVEANRPSVSVDISKMWFNTTDAESEGGEKQRTALVHLRAAFTNRSRSSPTTMTVRAAFVDGEGNEWGAVHDISFFRQPRPHQLLLPPGDVVESTLLISGDLGKTDPDELEIELRFSHPFEGQLKPIRVTCARLGTPVEA